MECLFAHIECKFIKKITLALLLFSLSMLSGKQKELQLFILIRFAYELLYFEYLARINYKKSKFFMQDLTIIEITIIRNIFERSHKILFTNIVLNMS